MKSVLTILIVDLEQGVMMRKLFAMVALVASVMVAQPQAAQAAVVDLNTDVSFSTFLTSDAPVKADTLLITVDPGFTATIDFGFFTLGTGGFYYNVVPGGETFSLLSSGLTSLILDAGSYTISVGGASFGGPGVYSGSVEVAAVPEIGTWAMMLAGFGLAGVALRRRRQTPALAAI